MFLKKKILLNESGSLVLQSLHFWKQNYSLHKADNKSFYKLIEIYMYYN